MTPHSEIQAAREVAQALAGNSEPSARGAFDLGGDWTRGFAAFVEDMLAWLHSDATFVLDLSRFQSSGTVAVVLSCPDPADFGELRPRLLRALEPHRPAPMRVEVRRA